jgi:RNA polymerase sigma-70 factor (ECF subfamily)
MERLDLDDEALARVDELAGVDVRVWLEDLPPEQAVAVRARVVDGRAYAELAAAAGTSEAAARQRVSRGLAALRARLRGELE